MRSAPPLVYLLLLLSFFSNAQSPGTLDVSFSNDGKAYAAPGGSGGFPVDPTVFNRSSGIVATSSRIYVTGTSSVGNDMDFGLAVFDLNGNPDASFSGDGLVTVNSGDKSDYATDVIVQSDGKILIGGFNSTDFVVIRFNTNGTLDPSWGGNGIVTTDVTGTSERVTRLALQSDGKVIAAGYSGTNINDITVVRYNLNGTVDTSFADHGFLNEDLQTRDDRIEGIAIQPDDKILLVGSSAHIGNMDGFIIRLTSDGSFDNTFNGTGLSIIDYGGNEELSNVTGLPDGKILMSGYKVAPNSGMYRYNSNGTIDSSFGAAGFASTDVGMWSVGVAYSSGKYILFGYTYGPPSRDFAIVVFDPEGGLDNCFGVNGIFKTDMGSTTEDYASTGVLQADGKLLITGQYGNDSQYALARITGPTPYIDKSVTRNGATLTANQSGATYQWKDCNSDSDLNGETGQSLTRHNGGNYKVIISQYGCSVGSTCYACASSNQELGVSICPGTKFSFAGQEFGDAGKYTHVFTNKTGCDSTIVLNLTINQIQSLDLTKSICKGENYILGHQILSTTGKYTEIFKDRTGCDSTVVLSLNVVDLNNSVTHEGFKLIANEPDAAYQWFTCEDNSIKKTVSGATGKIFLPATTGSYLVSIVKNGCTVYSDCEYVTITGVGESINTEFTLYPNPVTENLIVNLGFTSKSVKVVVMNVMGAEINTRTFSNTESFELAMADLPSGVYFLRIKTDTRNFFTKIIKP